MFKNSYKMLFMFILMMGTMITISSNSWFSAWMGLEINLLSFIPLMNNNKNLMSNEASLKYFLIQTLASLMMLFMVILMLMKFNMMYEFNNNNIYNKMIIFSTLMLKSGTAPFHFWFPTVMEGLNWMNALILMTWQKIAPLTLVSYFNFKLFMITFIIFSVIIGSLGGLNQTSLKKIMAFSSINHLGWMLSAMMSSESMWLFYFLIYCFLSINLIMLFNIFKLMHINQLFSVFFNSKINKFIFFFNLLSLGGLPPFLGFLPKWLIIQNLVMNSQLMLMTLITTMTLITLFYYLRLCYSAFMINHFENNWNYKMFLNKSMSNMFLLFSFISSFSLSMITLLFFLI